MKRKLATLALALSLLVPFGGAAPAQASGICWHETTTGWHYTSSNVMHRIDYVAFPHFKYYSTAYKISGGWVYDYWSYSTCFYI